MMKQKTKAILDHLIQNYPQLARCMEDIEKVFNILKQTYENRGKVLICGNGGSAADSEHIVGELMKGFMLKRSLPKEYRDKLTDAFKEEGHYLADHLQGALPAISLVSQSAIAYAFINDVAPDMVFAQQVFGYGKPGDALIGLSTSGNSKNVINSIKVAKAFGLKVVGMTGEKGGMMKELCDAIIRVPSDETYKIQEYHLPVYHAICAMIELELFDE